MAVKRKIIKKVIKVLVYNMTPKKTGIIEYPLNIDGTLKDIQIGFDIDVVILYLNSNDDVWLNTYKKYIHDNNVSDTQWESRLNSVDMLKWQLRSIAENMHYVRKIHIVVSNIEQVPSWVDREKVNIVLHKDIIPEKYLPTFNSCTIELFLHKIPDLAENFIYFNDDMYVLQPLNPENFFLSNGVSRNGFRCKGYCGLKKPNKDGKYNYWFICKNSTHLAKKAAKLKITHFDKIFSTIPLHQCKPMKKQWFIELWNNIEEDLNNSITQLRSNINVSIYIVLNYAYFSKQTTNDNQIMWFNSFMHKEKHQSVNLDKLNTCICGCINTDNQKYLNEIKIKFNKKCKYEI